MTKTNAQNLYFGLEIGNRTSVGAGIIEGSSKEKVIIQPTVYKPFSKNIFTASPGIGAIEHDSKWYQVGDGADGKPGAFALTSMDKYSDSDGMVIVFKSLLSQILPRGKDKVYNAVISFGVPFGWQTDEVKKAIKAALSGTHRINGLNDCGRVMVNPKNITIYHEPVGAYAYHAYRVNKGHLSDIFVLDIGLTTSDLLAIVEGALDNNQTGTIDYGMTMLYTKLQNYFQPLEKTRRPVKHWEQFAHSYRSNGKLSPVDTIILEFVKELVNQVTAVWSGLSNKPNLLLVGGGGAFLTKYFEALGIDFLPVDNHQTINAHGLLLLAANNNSL